MRPEWKRSRRGLSTVVTTAIMLAAVSVMGTSAVSWSNSNLFVHEQVMSSSYAADVNKINENLAIENIWFCKSCYQIQNPTAPHGVNITLTNTGNLAINVTQIQINNVNFVYHVNTTPIFPGKSFSWQQNYDWQSKSPINIYVTTARGSIFTTQAAPP